MRLRLFASVLSISYLFIAACAGPIQKAEQYAGQDEWMRAVIEYRKAANKNPSDVEFKSRLKQTELKAADYYYQRGLILLEQDNLDGAILQFQQGLAAMPDHSKLLQAMNSALARKEANNLYKEGQHAEEAGNNEEARRNYEKALKIYPEHKLSDEAASRLVKKTLAEQGGNDFALSSRAPITLNFRQTDLRTAFEFIAKSFGVNVIFDDSVRSTPVTLFAKDVTFEQALNLMFTTTKTFYKKIGANTILIAPDSKEKRGQYEDQIVRTFPLITVKAKEMADIIKGLLTVKKLIINEQLNTLILRDNEETLKLVERLIETNDKKPAEMILEVEILEVNRSKAEKLGLDLGTYQVSAGVPSSGTILAAKSLTKSLQSTATLTLPSATFRFFKQDVDAKTLANPKIRVLNGKPAKIHIGDRVPLRAATITDATGQVRTTFDYKEIGIRLNVEPTINLDNSATVKLGLEVSSLGQNLGSANEPAFQIGTRNAETVMLLRDGETAILGGLIRDEDRNTKVRVPYLGDIPAVGVLFSSYDNSDGRTDVLLTITPRVVRGWDLPPKGARQFYSGTEDRYTTSEIFADAAPAQTNAKPVISTNQQGPVSASDSTTNTLVPLVPLEAGSSSVLNSASQIPTVDSSVQATSVESPAIQPQPVFAFSEAVYEAASDQEFDIQLTGENLSGPVSLPIEVLYNPQLLKLVKGQPGSFPAQGFKVDGDESRGVMRINLDFTPQTAPKGSGVLARITLRGSKPGISYLVYKMPAIKNTKGESINAQVRASRIVIK